MPRVYVSKSAKPYKRYDPLTLKNAIEAYENGNNSIVEVAKHFNISKSVLHRHVTRIMKTQGGQKCLSEEAEKYIIKYINICSEWGYPLDTYDLRIIIKGYLDRVGLEVKRFNSNLPGVNFIHSFLKRHHQEISLRISQNIKRARAAVSPEIIEDYFIQLQNSTVGVPLCNIVNYDESNLSDDPGKKKVLTKRGVKYPERVMNHTKSSTSLMLAASADGTLLPCYVVYKAAHLYTTWTTNGPPNCRYNRTSSGWFDGNTFEDWVETVALPYFNNKTGKKILIGDNLSSHLSLDIIKKCQEQDVYFVFLPPNSTHLTQPLDVAFFRPMKIAWRDILFTWKKTEGRVLPTIPKNVFPKLLKKMLEKMEPNIKQNILAGFMKAGISPLNKEKVLNRLPGNHKRHELSMEEKEAIDESVLSLLKEMRYGSQSTRITNKKKKINVIPGKSVEDSDYIDSDISSSNTVSDIEPKITSKKIERSQNKTTDKNPTQTEKENLIPQVTRLNTKGKGIGKKSKPRIEEKHILKEQEHLNIDLIDIDKMPVILEDDFLVTQEITIHSETNPFFSEKQEEELIIEHSNEQFSKVTDNNITFTERNSSDEKKIVTDIQQKEATQFEVHKPLSKKKIAEGKKIHILSDEKIIYKSNAINPIKLKLSTSRLRKAKEYKNNDSSQTKPGPSGLRRPSYYKNDVEILRDLMDLEDSD